MDEVHVAPPSLFDTHLLASNILTRLSQFIALAPYFSDLGLRNLTENHLQANKHCLKPTTEG
jgi:hypothetical protein